MPQTQNIFAQFKNSSGKAGQGQLDAQNAQLVGQRHGKYFEAALAGTSGRAANQTGATTSIALATTCVGFTLSNPTGSGKNLIIQKAGFLLTTGAAANQVGLYTGFLAAGITVHTTPLTIYNNFVGSAVTGLVAKADAACTLVGTGGGAPAWQKWLYANAAAGGTFSGDFDIDGEFVVPPGGYIGIGTLVASAAAGFFGAMSWEEA